MLLSTFTEPSHGGTLVFVLINAEKHGLERIEPQPLECDCGHILTAHELDRGDQTKSASSSSWREGGRKKCPECVEYPSLEREDYLRAQGFVPTPQSEIRSITPNQRAMALDEADNTCVRCGSEADYVKRIVPPRYDGSRDQVNLAPLCGEHYENYGHMFVDLLVPYDWHRLHDTSFMQYSEIFIEKFGDRFPEKLISKLIDLRKRGEPENPYPYILSK